MSSIAMDVPTSDGSCPSVLLTPDGEGPWPAVIVFMDAGGVRPAIVEIGEHIAAMGYVALVPEMYYRHGPYEPFKIETAFTDPDERERLGGLVGELTKAMAASDTGAFLDFLAARPEVAGAKVGTTGYCMGGGMALTAAGTYPDRVAAAASFHGGKLATDSPLSPHLLAPKMKAEIYVAGADEDDSYPLEMATHLEQALTAAHVTHRCEIYEGARHGWTMPDFPIYDEAAAERAWRELFALFARNLR